MKKFKIIFFLFVSFLSMPVLAQTGEDPLLNMIKKLPKDDLQQSVMFHPADATRVDHSYIDAQIMYEENCRKELEIALADPEKYLDMMISKIQRLLMNENSLYYFEAHALSSVLEAGLIKDLSKVRKLTALTTSVLETIYDNLRKEDKKEDQWGFIYVMSDFVGRTFFSVDKHESDASYLMEILSSVAIGYGEEALDLDGVLSKEPRTTSEILKHPIINHGYEPQTKVKGLAIIESFARRTEDYLSFKAQARIFNIAVAEKERNPEKEDIECVEILENLAYSNPLLNGPTYGSVVDLWAGDRNLIAQQQTQAVVYLGVLGEKDFLNNYYQPSGASNKTAQNVVAYFLGKEEPYPYHEMISSITDFVVQAKDLALMTSSVKWSTLPFSAGSNTVEGWASSKLVNSKPVYSFSDVEGMTINVNSSFGGGAGTAVLEIPQASSIFSTVYSFQPWTIPNVIKNSGAMNSLFYIVRVVPSVAYMVDQYGAYSIDAVNRIVKPITEHPLSKTKEAQSYVTITVTLPDGKRVDYLVLVKTQADKDIIAAYTANTFGAGLTVEVNYDNVFTPNTASFSSHPTSNVSKIELNPEMETQISLALENAGLSPAEQAKFFNAFKNGKDLSGSNAAIKFIDGNSMVSSVQVSVNRSGAIVLSIVRTISGVEGFLEFTRDFSYSASDTKVKEDSKVSDAEGATALSSEVAAEAESDYSDYNNNCKGITPSL